MGKLSLKRFKLSHYLLITQVLASVISLCLFQSNSQTADLVGMLWNLINAVALLVACLFEDSVNEKYYELVGRFIFEKLGDNLSSFLDYVMSDEYKAQNFNERVFFKKELMGIAKDGTYEGRRKLSRALPTLYDIDKSNTVKMVKFLRSIYGTEQDTDIRRRTIESMLFIIQKGETEKERRKRFLKFKKEIVFLENDNTYCLIALLELIFFVKNYVELKDKELQKIDKALEDIKRRVGEEINKESTIFPEDFVADFENCYLALEALRDISHRGHKKGETDVNQFLEVGGKFTKLTIIKNLYYTCPGYPNCVSCGECVNNNSEYLLSKVLLFLTNPPDNDEYLAMPTARYFDCVCSNLKKNPNCDNARKVMEAYFVSPILLINKTSFDKFSKLVEINRDFAKEVVFDMLDSLTDRANVSVTEILDLIDQLPEEKKKYYIVKEGRKKIHINKRISYTEKVEKAMESELIEIDSKIKRHHELISFIGDVKRAKGNKKL